MPIGHRRPRHELLCPGDQGWDNHQMSSANHHLMTASTVIGHPGQSFGLWPDFPQLFGHMLWAVPRWHICSDWGRWKAAGAPAVNAAVLFGGQVPSRRCTASGTCTSCTRKATHGLIKSIVSSSTKIRPFTQRLIGLSLEISSIWCSKSSCFLSKIELLRRALTVPGRCLELSFAGGISGVILE